MRRYRIGMLTQIEKRLTRALLNFWSECKKAGCQIGCLLPVTARASSERPFPFTRETISSCPPCLICLGLSWQKLHKNDTGNLKAPSLHLSPSLLLSIIFFSQAFPLSILFREMLKQKLGSSVQMTGSMLNTCWMMWGGSALITIICI